MAYTITNTAGTTIAVVDDGTSNVSATSITLLGKNYAGYGNVQNHNFVQLLENFASATAPLYPTEGQLWWNSTTNVFNVYNGTTWKVLSNVESGLTAPTTPQIGDLWFNTTTQQLNVYNGSSWIIVGPDYTSTQGVSGILPFTVWDNAAPAAQHTILKIMVGAANLGVISGDSFTVNSNVGLTGFSVLAPGVTLSTVTPFPLINGYAPLSSPAFTNFPTAPTQSSSDNTTKLATTAFVGTAITNALNTAGGTITSVQNNLNLLRIDVGNLIGNVDTRFGSVYTDISYNTANITALHSTVNTFTGNVNSRFLAVNTAITSNVSRIDSTLTTFIGNVDSRFLAVNNGSTGTNIRIDNLSTRIDGLNIPSMSGFAVLSQIDNKTQTFTTPIVFQSTAQVVTKDKETNTSEAASTAMVRSLVDDRQPMWGSSHKFVSTVAPLSTNGVDGDFWFQIAP